MLFTYIYENGSHDTFDLLSNDDFDPNKIVKDPKRVPSPKREMFSFLPCS